MKWNTRNSTTTTTHTGTAIQAGLHRRLQQDDEREDQQNTDAGISEGYPMTPQPQQDRCVLTRHDVQSIKDLVFVVGGNSESSAQKAIFEILANNMRRSRPAPASDEMAFKDSIIEQQKIHIKVLNEKMVEMMQGAAAQARDDVLEEILDHLEPYGLKSRGGIAQETIWTTGMLRAYIQSLRSTTTAKERDTP